MANSTHLQVLKQGTKIWNAWREAHPEVKVDLSKADLSGANLSEVFLRGANLSKADLSGAKLIEADLSRARLDRANLTRASLRGADLNGADLSGAKAIEADLRQADLIETDLRRIRLNGADLRRANLNEANLHAAELVGAKLQRADLRMASPIEADLHRANLEGADLRLAHLIETNLSRANLRKADLRRADLWGAILSDACLEGARLVSARVTGVDFERAILTGVCIQDWQTSSETNLEGVICEYIYLRWHREKNELTDRRPHAGNFAPGEFTRIYQMRDRLETLEISFAHGIEWHVFYAALRNAIAREKGGTLYLQAFEEKPGGALAVRLGVPEGTDKQEIARYIKQEYWKNLQLVDSEYAEQLRQHGDRLQLTPEQIADCRERVLRERQERERTNASLLDIVATLATSNRYAIARHLQQIDARFPYYNRSTRENKKLSDRLARKNGAAIERAAESDTSQILPLH